MRVIENGRLPNGWRYQIVEWETGLIELDIAEDARWECGFSVTGTMEGIREELKQAGMEE